ncbi:MULTISPECIES: phosphopantetheine-binding protein [unclassified Streptomyces]|uniref:phosphopantetheine-binding protein n=1 Tax=unclassified Streptomyces TaxID=2593676 RepID=UPI002DDC7D32|nr:phosphopantetheine-binding protein [Streptomyces sp. NBC_01750]WSA98213.1 phosphopantetheine-binding protein [Streptomyces sp. NBC_01794]WSD37250.1 phosphopantetheine-binding protein [Streptomyces sp. NBC_01750]
MQYARSIKEFVVEQFLPDVSAGDLDDDLDLLENGIIDSLGLLKVIAWLEDRYGINTDEVDLDPDSFKSVASIEEFIAHASRERAGAA